MKVSLNNNPIPSYHLSVGKAGEKNLESQHIILAEHSIDQLQKSGLKEGMIVFDIGCGSGTMTEYLANIVGDNGHVYAMDMSQEQVDTAKQRIKNKGLKNVSFIVGDVTIPSNLPTRKADIVYSRLILMHIQDPKKAIINMTALLKNGGILSLQESTTNSYENFNKNPVIDKYFNLMISLSVVNNVDYNIGRKLPIICEELSVFSKIDHYNSRYILDSIKTKKLLLKRLQEWKQKAVNATLITNDELAVVEKDLKNFLYSKDSISFEQTHIIATI